MFYFNQKTAYGMRIRYWSSDVCSSDLLLATAVSLADNAENIPLWWISSLCRHLIDDLWQHSLHQSLPTEPPEGTEEKYPDLRRPFISSLYARKTSEVELWPSQRAAAQRSTDVRSEEHTSELQTLMSNSYAVICLNK